MIKLNAILILFIMSSVLLMAHPGVGIVVDSKGNVFNTDLYQIWKIGSQEKKL
jgi:hypothetical protein